MPTLRSIFLKSLFLYSLFLNSYLLPVPALGRRGETNKSGVKKFSCNVPVVCDVFLRPIRKNAKHFYGRKKMCFRKTAQRAKPDCGFAEAEPPKGAKRIQSCYTTLCRTLIGITSYTNSVKINLQLFSPILDNDDDIIFTSTFFPNKVSS